MKLSEAQVLSSQDYFSSRPFVASKAAIVSAKAKLEFIATAANLFIIAAESKVTAAVIKVIIAAECRSSFILTGTASCTGLSKLVNQEVIEVLGMLATACSRTLRVLAILAAPQS